MKQETINIGVYRILRKLGISRQEIDPEADFDDDYFLDDAEKRMLFNFVEFRYQIQLSSNDENNIHKVKHLSQVIASKN